MNPTKSIYAKLVPNQRRELIRTAAGPSRAEQCVFIGGPYTV